MASSKNKQPARVIRERFKRADPDTKYISIPGPVPAGSSPTVRLGSVSSDFDFDAAKVAEAIDYRPGGACFCDSTVFIAPTDECIWSSLLRQKRTVLIPPMLKELRWWLADSEGENREAWRQVNAHLKGDRAAEVRTIDYIADVSSAAINYYINLLGLRKHIFGIVRERLTKELGKPPTKVEISNYCQQAGTSRAQLLGRQGENNKIPEHLYNDETLAVVAVLHAITTGEEVTIVTSDEAVLDQCCKLIDLLSWQYIALCLADEYCTNPARYPVRIIDNPAPDSFSDSQIRILSKISSTATECWPRRYTSVLVHCMLLHQHVSRVTYKLDRQIRWLLDNKTRTNGLNTERLDGLNLHLFPAELVRRGYGDVAIIAHDMSIPTGGAAMRIAAHDVELVLHSIEGTTPVEFIDLSKSGLVGGD
jgi:hypothetical protein